MMNRRAMIAWLSGVASGLACLSVCGHSGAGPDAPSLPAPAPESAAAFRARLDQVFSSPALANVRTGVEAADCDSGEIVYARNATDLLNPASNLKILTSSVALEVLGPAYTFRTTLLRDGPLENGTIKGNLYVKGEGDPELVYESVWKIVKDIQALGVNGVAGDLIADDTYFDDQRTIPDWDEDSVDDETHAYNAPLGALSFNFNTVALVVRPGNVVGAPVQVGVETPTEFVKIVNHASTGRRNTRNTLSFNRNITGNQIELQLGGRMPVNGEARRFYRTVPNPPRFAGTLLAELMVKEGITFTGQVRVGKTPADALPVYFHYSRPLDILLKYMNKLSSNFIAEQLLKTLGAHEFGVPGTSAKGLRVLRDYLQRSALPWEKAEYYNGSGLSYRTAVSAHQLVSLLCHEYRDLRHRYDYLATFPIAGVDGTMRRRMIGTPGAGNVRAKTGSVKGVFGFSGYLHSSAGRTLAFSFLVNGIHGSVVPIKLAQDRWANLLIADQGEGVSPELSKVESTEEQDEPVDNSDLEGAGDPKGSRE